MSNDTKGAVPSKRWKPAKGKGLKIDGVPLITDDNVNDENIVTIILNVQKRTGRTYFGKAIVQK